MTDENITQLEREYFETPTAAPRWDLLAHHIGPATARAGRTHQRRLLSWGEAVAFLIAMAAVGFAAAAWGVA